MKILDQVKATIQTTHVFGEPYEKDGVTVIPASRVSGGGGGGGGPAFLDGTGTGGGGAGLGLDAKPAGAFVIKDGEVTWIPALDVTRLAILGQVLVIAAILS